MSEAVPPVRMGISGFGIELGAPQDVRELAHEYVADPERVLRWGYRTFHRLDEGISTTDMCATAAFRALENAGLRPVDVDYLVLATTGIPDYHYWDCSAALARALGLRLVPTLWLNQGCLSGTASLSAIAGLMAINADVSTVLLVAVNRTSEFHRNRMRTNSCLASDGAVGAVLTRVHPRVTWLASAQITDPELCDWFRLDFGGRVQPVPPAGWSNEDSNSLDYLRDHFAGRDGDFAKFLVQVNERVSDAVDQACARARVAKPDVTRLIYLNDNQLTIAAVARAVGLPIERTNADLARALGHLGAADQLADLALHLEAGDLAEGDTVALTGLSSGLHWFCALIRI
jgi:3-oxoacyl-[acyl-carrier-protein] synthase-3